MSLLPYNASPIERALESVGSRDLPVPIADLWNPDTCPASLLPWLAWAMHVDNWDDAATDDQKRDAIRMSVHLHRKKGTPWALKRALATLGLDIDLIDQQEQRAIYAVHNPARLDGTWALDGSVQIKPLALVTGIPQIQHWAQFIVRLNLADVNNPAILSKLRALINEWKPQRSWPLFVYWLRFYFHITVGVQSRFVMQKRVFIPIWGQLVVTSHPEYVWKLGRSGRYARLDGTWALDGSTQVGKLLGHVPGPKLRSYRIATRATLVKRFSVDMRPRQRLTITRTITTPAPIRLGREARRLDGSWRIGVETRLDGTWRLDGNTRLPSHPMSVAPRLGQFKIHTPAQTIPDPAHAGRLKLDGSWQVGGPARPESRIVSTRI
ncbi:phage tail protein I [Alcaligenaceae bacterium]|nr:phage tail protein I [Alcaligenaceae bacterium]